RSPSRTAAPVSARWPASAGSASPACACTPSTPACPRCSAASASRSSRPARGCSPTVRPTRRAWVGKSSPTSGDERPGGVENMSRIGKLPVPVPSGVDVTIDGPVVTVKGPKGTLSHTVAAPIIVEKGDEGVLDVKRPEHETASTPQHGLTRTLVNNMVVGVTDGYEKRLEIVGVGYR